MFSLLNHLKFFIHKKTSSNRLPYLIGEYIFISSHKIVDVKNAVIRRSNFMCGLQTLGLIVQI